IPSSNGSFGRPSIASEGIQEIAVTDFSMRMRPSPVDEWASLRRPGRPVYENGAVDVVALIPARGGSKGIPRKNLAPVAGRPLLAWTVDAARESRTVTRTVVSTEDEGIAAAAREAGAEVLDRPAALAADDTPMRDVVG